MSFLKKPPDGARPSRSIARALPAFRSPQLATLQKDVPEDDQWLFELKYDGYRCQAAIAGKEVRLYSRNGEDWSQQFGDVIPALSTLTKGTLLLDGEICAIDDDGRTDFALATSRLGGNGPLTYFAFDLLEQDGENVAELPQVERKRRLAALLADEPADSPLLYSPHVVGNGKRVFEAIRAGGYEGVVAKWPTARYYAGGASTAWLKIKVLNSQDFVVIGWRASPSGQELDGLFLATFEEGRLNYRGLVTTGVAALHRDVSRTLSNLQTRRRPKVYGMPRAEMRAAHWVERRLLAEVEFAKVLPGGVLERPTLKRLQEGKDVRGVRLEFMTS